MNKHKKGMGRKPGGREWAKERRLRTVGYASLGLVGAIGMMALFPLGASDTNAAETIDVSYTAKTSLSVKVDPSITLVGTDAVTNRGFVSGSANLTVATSNSTGYSVFMTTADGNTALTNTTNAGAKINSIASDTVGKNMGSNVWGWTFDGSSLDTTYHPIPANANTAIHKTNTASANEGDSYSLSFGANVDNSLPAGDYNSSILVSVIGNYVPVGDATDISQIKTMQEMNATVCSNMTSEQQYQLEDARDGKTYYIARLKDGHCWMTQNLALDLVEGITYTPANTDVKQDWTVTSAQATISDFSQNAGSWKSNAGGTGHESYGNYYTPSTMTAGGSTSTNGSSPTSICPKGWRAPSGSTSGGSVLDYQALINAYGLTNDIAIKVQQAPLYFVKAGLVHFSQYTGGKYVLTPSKGVGTDGYYATTHTGSNMALGALSFSDATISVTDLGRGSSGMDSYFSAGYPLRCIAR